VTVALGLIAFLIILTILVFVHELGHFSLAKLTGVRVDEFAIGFPPRLKSWTKNGTAYSINAIPLGGYVRMKGENGQRAGEATDDSFAGKAPWKRLSVLLAGPISNILLAFVIFFAIYIHGLPRGANIVTRVLPGSPAALAGIQSGDRITSINGVKIDFSDQIANVEDSHAGEQVTLIVGRGNRRIARIVTIRAHPPAGQGAMGIVLRDTTNVAYTPSQALGQSVQDVQAMVGTIPLAFQSQFGGNTGGARLSGPIGIAHITTQVVQQAPEDRAILLLQLTALLSANLGILNLLPFPALDGGRIVLVLASWVRRRNISPDVEGLIHLAGLAVLLAFILVISYQDIVSWLGGSS
jgi:regulator of sigma E protease